MKNNRLITVIFYVAGIYDGVLGLSFLLFPNNVFRLFGVTAPNHMGYVQFPAALLLVFAAMFFAIAAKPLPNRNLIPYSILFKVSYSGVVLWHWLFGDIPYMWKPFAVSDIILALLFIWAYGNIGKQEKPI